MNYRTQFLAIGSLALLCVLASSGCGDGDVAPGPDGGPPDFRTIDVVFEPNIATMSLRPEANPERNVYFGDLHVHTEYSLDAFAYGSLATPRDAYRYAKGEAIPHPSGYDIQLSRPLDFYAVTDHAYFLGQWWSIKTNPNHPLADDADARSIADAKGPSERGRAFGRRGSAGTRGRFCSMRSVGSPLRPREVSCARQPAHSPSCPRPLTSIQRRASSSCGCFLGGAPRVRSRASRPRRRR